jgi:hypothetical protein
VRERVMMRGREAYPLREMEMRKGCTTTISSRARVPSGMATERLISLEYWFHSYLTLASNGTITRSLTCHVNSMPHRATRHVEQHATSAVCHVNKRGTTTRSLTVLLVVNSGWGWGEGEGEGRVRVRLRLAHRLVGVEPGRRRDGLGRRRRRALLLGLLADDRCRVLQEAREDEPRDNEPRDNAPRDNATARHLRAARRSMSMHIHAGFDAHMHETYMIHEYMNMHDAS